MVAAGRLRTPSRCSHVAVLLLLCFLADTLSPSQAQWICSSDADCDYPGCSDLNTDWGCRLFLCGYAVAGTCQGPPGCAPGQHSKNGLVKPESCSPCTAGTFGKNTFARTCDSCTAGTFSHAGASICSACLAGYFSGEGASTCSQCSLGWTSTQAATVCSPCLPGTYGSEPGRCQPCDAGTYTNISGSVACTRALCEPGTYSRDVSSSKCLDCLPGKYAAEGGASMCVSCTAGTYSALWVKSTTCLSCEAGTYSSEGMSACEECWPGTYSKELKATSNETCRVCPVFTTSGVEAGSCVTDVRAVLGSVFGTFALIGMCVGAYRYGAYQWLRTHMRHMSWAGEDSDNTAGQTEKTAVLSCPHSDYWGNPEK
uniref:Tyrosine-protein kinase ephrin type A/B receptor-like domain-containing protein n=1 Tax=Hemiselmis andersenii TaxID=464988 RepID=A0A7S0UDK8_HEMAN|mmetsp:Transcript_8496/g.19727  ORF Transcript_8496/g.19727 Transcript_8496/m.19727 type:complete len:370 (+) Transcript_8496:76-1185(+)